MERIMKNILILLIALSQILFWSGEARPGLYDWANNPSVSRTDPDDPLVPGGQDILKVWYATDSGFHYFRMDLEAAPSSTAGGYSELYGIFIDSRPGGANGGSASFGYIPASFSGIDVILDSHYHPYMGPWIQSDYHSWNAATSTFDLVRTPPYAGSDFVALQDGAILEWKVKKDALPGSFNWYAATHNVGLTCPVGTNDTVSVVPLPSALWLLGTGLLALVGIRRRNIGKPAA
jgi:hypothetical protein